MIDEETIQDLDNDWIELFNKNDEEFKNYYCEDLSFIKIHSIYINSINEIDIIKEEKYLFKTQGLLSKEELLQIIKNNSFINGQKYSLFGILKYNIDIKPENLKTLFKSNNNNYFNTIKNIDDIHFSQSISMFHDINELFILFHQLICIPSNKQNNSIANNGTKKIYINLNTNKKTKRKLYKESRL